MKNHDSSVFQIWRKTLFLIRGLTSLDARRKLESIESPKHEIHYDGMHGFKVTAVKVDNVIQESMANNLLDF